MFNKDLHVSKAEENNVHTKEGLINELVSIHHFAWEATLGDNPSDESYFVSNALDRLIDELRSEDEHKS